MLMDLLPPNSTPSVWTKKLKEIMSESENNSPIKNEDISIAKMKLLKQLDSMTELNDTVNTQHSYFDEKIDILENSELSTRSTNYNLSSPVLALEITDDFKTIKNNFTKGCKWSPDGLCLLVASEDKHLRIYNFPNQIADGSFMNECWFSTEYKNFTNVAVDVQENELILDYSWFPHMNSNNRQTCCFLTTCRDLPIHLWDAWTGDLICNYRYFNNVDELSAAQSVTFSNDGSKILAGFNKKICMFDTSRPGRQFVTFDSKDHTGIMSCFACHPVIPTIFAVGSYNGSIGFYSHKYKRHFMRLDGHKGGVTQMIMSSDGTKLFSGARMDNDILCWDLRNPGTILHCLTRVVQNNQRVFFDLKDNNLISGTTDGQLYHWDLSKENNEFFEPTSRFSPHVDSTNGISIHPHYPIIATSSGQRHSLEMEVDSDDENYQKTHNYINEASVKMWYLGQN